MIIVINRVFFLNLDQQIGNMKSVSIEVKVQALQLIKRVHGNGEDTNC